MSCPRIVLAGALIAPLTACVVDDDDPPPAPAAAITATAAQSLRPGQVHPYPCGATGHGLAQLTTLMDAYAAQGQTRALDAELDALLAGDGWRFFQLDRGLVLAPAPVTAAQLQAEYDLQLSLPPAALAARIADAVDTFACEVFTQEVLPRPSGEILAMPGAELAATPHMSLVAVIALTAQLAQQPQPPPPITPVWPTDDWPTIDLGTRSPWSFEEFECGGGSGGAAWYHIPETNFEIGAFVCTAPWAGEDEYAGGFGLRLSL